MCLANKDDLRGTRDPIREVFVTLFTLTIKNKCHTFRAVTIFIGPHRKTIKGPLDVPIGTELYTYLTPVFCLWCLSEGDIMFFPTRYLGMHSSWEQEDAPALDSSVISRDLACCTFPGNLGRKTVMSCPPKFWREWQDKYGHFTARSTLFCISKAVPLGIQITNCFRSNLKVTKLYIWNFIQAYMSNAIATCIHDGVVT